MAEIDVPQNVLIALVNRKYLTLTELSGITCRDLLYLRNLMDTMAEADLVKYDDFDGVIKVSLNW